jgi:hypothetical protein
MDVDLLERVVFEIGPNPAHHLWERECMLCRAVPS